MNRISQYSLVVMTTLGLTLPLSAEGLSQGDRDFAMSSLHATRKLFLDSVAGLSEAQWNYKPSPDKWSVAECAEHIALSESFIMSLVTDKLVKAPPETDKKVSAEEARKKDEKLLAAVVDRSSKFQAPEPIKPKKTFSTPQEAVEQFKKKRDANIEYIKTTQDDLRAHFAPHPAIGPMDAFDWVLLVSAHSERHTRQLQEVKADPGFPKK